MRIRPWKSSQDQSHFQGEEVVSQSQPERQHVLEEFQATESVHRVFTDCSFSSERLQCHLIWRHKHDTTPIHNFIHSARRESKFKQDSRSYSLLGCRRVSSLNPPQILLFVYSFFSFLFFYEFSQDFHNSLPCLERARGE